MHIYCDVCKTLILAPNIRNHYIIHKEQIANLKKSIYI